MPLLFCSEWFSDATLTITLKEYALFAFAFQVSRYLWEKIPCIFFSAVLHLLANLEQKMKIVLIHPHTHRHHYSTVGG